jgi:predicted Zn-dependent protease
LPDGREWETASINTNPKPDACTDNSTSNDNVWWDLEGLVTHEYGHALGLDDINPDNHPTLTMRGTMGPCTINNRSLAKGDILGLRRIYR